MEDFEKILLTGAMTILGGFIIHSASQLFLWLFIEPLQKFRHHRSEAVTLLSFYSNILDSQLKESHSSEYRERYDKAQNEIRMCMANIKASYYSISPHLLAVLLGAIPKKSKFKKVSNNLLTLSFLGQSKIDSDNFHENLELAKSTIQILGAEW